jgi:small-conductance mechanosensitive channel
MADNENLEPTPKVEEQKEVSQIEGKVSGEKGEEVKPTLSEEEKINQRLNEALEAKEKEWQSRKDKELSELQSRIGQLNKQLKEKELSTLEKRELETWGDTDEVKNFQAQRRKFQEELVTFEDEKQSILSLQEKLNEEAKTVKAGKLAKEYGVDAEKLLEAKSPDEMEKLALKLGHQKLQAKLKDMERTPQKIDSGIAGGAGITWRDLPTDDKLRKGLQSQ